MDILVLGAGILGNGLDGPEVARQAQRLETLQAVIGVFRPENMDRVPAMAVSGLCGYIAEQELWDLLVVALETVHKERFLGFFAIEVG